MSSVRQNPRHPPRSTTSRRNKTFTLTEREMHRSHLDKSKNKTTRSFKSVNNEGFNKIRVAEEDVVDTLEENLDRSGTPTPSEKVSRWHRDIFLVSPASVNNTYKSSTSKVTDRPHIDQQVHPRQCLCDQCMAEYGTFKYYNQMLSASGKDLAKIGTAAGNGTISNNKIEDSEEGVVEVEEEEDVNEEDLEKAREQRKLKAKAKISGLKLVSARFGRRAHFHPPPPPAAAPKSFTSNASSTNVSSSKTVVEEIRFGDHETSSSGTSYDNDGGKLGTFKAKLTIIDDDSDDDGFGFEDDEDGKLPDRDEVVVDMNHTEGAQRPSKMMMLMDRKRRGFGRKKKALPTFLEQSSNHPKSRCPSQMGSSTPDDQKGQHKRTYMCGKAEQSLFSRPSSTSGTDSSIRIRKTRAGCTERRWFICVSMAMVFTVVVASAGIFFGYQFLRSHLPNNESVFRGQFRVQSGDFLPEGVVEPGSYVHLEKSRFYQHKLDVILTGSPLAQSYMHNEVFLLEGHGPDGVTVHFNIHMDPTQGVTRADELLAVLIEEVERQKQESEPIASAGQEPEKSVLGDLVIDKDSLEIHERTSDSETSSQMFDSGSSYPSSDPTSRVSIVSNDVSNDITVNSSRRVCTPFDIGFCKQLPYNFTSYPNALGHADVNDATRDIDMFKQVVDSKCYSLAYEFVCQLLQPVCFQQKLVLPCRDFCSEFMESCGNLITDDVRAKIDCEALATESDGPGACISKPGCVAELRNAGAGERVCDGIVDCPDFSDELYCPYCPEHHFHCGVGKMCIPKSKMCDGNVDCDNGADEKGCLSLAPHMEFASYVHQYYPSGYLVYQEGGQAGKVCADHMNKTVPVDEVDKVLKKLGDSMCSMLEYGELNSIEIEVDQEVETNPDIRYVDMIGPMSDSKTFIDVPCPSKEVIKIECSSLECGRRPAHVSMESRARSDAEPRGDALHGDWPWHVALYKNGQHVCDGTLIGDQWIMTTSSCFQGQGKAKWVARFASVRLTSRAPWEQKRIIVGMVKSPVEGNSIVILKMDKPVVFSDFARPICVPSSDEFIHMGATCVTLGWNDEDEQLRAVYLEPAPREKCEEESEVSANTICTQEKLESTECQGEEFAGAPLVCQASGEWHLVGVAAWRKGCSSIAQRPRLYDKVSPNSVWATKTIEELEKKKEKAGNGDRNRIAESNENDTNR